jgi:hypothetical protein
LYKDNDIVTYIKVNRLRWAGHVIWLEEQSAARRDLVAVAEGKQQRGRPKLRWEDGVMDDARKLGEKTGGTSQGIRTAGGSFWWRPGLKLGCCADDDDDYLFLDPKKLAPSNGPKLVGYSFLSDDGDISCLQDVVLL